VCGLVVFVGSGLTVRFLPIECSAERLQESFSRQDAKLAKKDIILHIENLASFCAFARVVVYPIPYTQIQGKISNMFG
jgi:hypothetical protein